ncbi:MAG: preprotein translocase subunit SecE [Bacillota bacterium]|nr:preprotein translocase subunit SecE [Bacillota bacterium]
MAKNYFEGKTEKKQVPREKKKRRNPFRFFKEVFLELKKVSWPSRKDFITLSVAVVAFIVILAAIIFGMDSGLSRGLSVLIGGE